MEKKMAVNLLISMLAGICCGYIIYLHHFQFAYICIICLSTACSVFAVFRILYLENSIREYSPRISKLEDSIREYYSPRISKLEDSIREYYPKYIILIRHGESLGNMDEEAYRNIGDPKIELTQKGKEQAIEAGLKLKRVIGDMKIFIYSSPYVRAKQTRDGVLKAFPKSQIGHNVEDPRLREREFANGYQNEQLIADSKKVEKEYSKMYFRYHGGESNADVYDRVGGFISSLWRNFKLPNIQDAAVVIVAHGLTNRLFLMKWLHWDEAGLASAFNPGNGSLLVLKRQNKIYKGHPTYQLTPESCKELKICDRLKDSQLLGV
jgi:broad specificity phosphatase PhoE